MRELSVGILGIGWHLPAQVRGNDFWPAALRDKQEQAAAGNIIAVEKTTRGEAAALAPEIALAMARFADDPFKGVRKRHVLADDAEPSDMEAAAGTEALRDAGVRPDEIDVVMVASLVPDRLHPSNAPAVQAKCGLTRATAWCLDVGCASFQAQLAAAAGVIRSGLYRRVLMVFSCAVSRVLDYTSGLSTIFGDGAAAVVVGAVDPGYGLVGNWSRTDGALREGVVYAPMVEGAPKARWDLHCGRIQLTSLDPVSGKRAGLMSTAYCREACLGALDDAGLKLEDVSLLIANQSVAWLVDACRRNLGLAEHQAIDSFADVANIGAAALPYNLARAQSAGRLHDGDIVLFYSPGAGFTRSASVYRWKGRGARAA